MQENANYIAWWMLSTFWGVSARKKISVFILSPTVPKNRPKFWRKSRGSTLVKNLENFWKTIIEFDYRMMQRIMLISEAFTYPPWMIILLDLDNYPHHTQLYSTTWSIGTRWEMNCLALRWNFSSSVKRWNINGVFLQVQYVAQYPDTSV